MKNLIMIVFAAVVFVGCAESNPVPVKNEEYLPEITKGEWRYEEYLLGKESAAAGLCVGVCPYEEGTSRREYWTRGWVRQYRLEKERSSDNNIREEKHKLPFEVERDKYTR